MQPKDPCVTTTPTMPSCEPIVHKNNCCPPVGPFLARNVCDVDVHMPDCEWSADNADCNPCQCVPNFCDEEMAMTPMAKAAVMDMLSKLLQLVSPVPRCTPCGEIISVNGHTQPLSGTQKHNEMGQPLFNQCNADGSVTETTSVVNPVTNQPNQPILENFCCAPGLQHSPFLNSGVSPLRHKGGNHPGFLGGVAGVHTSEFHEKMGELFCCAYTAVSGAPILELEVAEEGE